MLWDLQSCAVRVVNLRQFICLIDTDFTLLVVFGPVRTRGLIVRFEREQQLMESLYQVVIVQPVVDSSSLFASV